MVFTVFLIPLFASLFYFHLFRSFSHQKLINWNIGTIQNGKNTYKYSKCQSNHKVFCLTVIKISSPYWFQPVFVPHISMFCILCTIDWNKLKPEHIENMLLYVLNHFVAIQSLNKTFCSKEDWPMLTTYADQKGSSGPLPGWNV